MSIYLLKYHQKILNYEYEEQELKKSFYLILYVEIKY